MYRKFEEAAPDHPEAELALKWIGELYEIDEKSGGDLEKKAELRRTESKEVLGKLKTWLWSQAVLKTLSIGEGRRRDRSHPAGTTDSPLRSHYASASHA